MVEGAESGPATRCRYKTRGRRHYSTILVNIKSIGTPDNPNPWLGANFTSSRPWVRVIGVPILYELTSIIIEKSGNMPSYSLVWVNMPSEVNMPSNVLAYP